MKFGFRKPSINKRFAARTSLKRVVRHNLGLKAPRGWGWVTNPKKAAYNRVYNRTTFGVGGCRRAGTQGSGGTAGCLILVAAFVLFLCWQAEMLTFLIVATIVAAAPVILVWWLVARHSRNVQYAQERQVEAERAQARQERYERLSQRFGAESAIALMEGRYWQGCTTEMVVEAIGPPLDVKEKVYKTKTKTTYCYRQIAKKRFGLKIHFEDGIVVGWDGT